jgi:hypothetical protein
MKKLKLRFMKIGEGEVKVFYAIQLGRYYITNYLLYIIFIDNNVLGILVLM